MKPYFKTEKGVLYHGDCLEIIKSLDPVNLVLTDPPYGLGKIKNYSGQLAKPGEYGDYTWNNSKPSKEYFKAIMDISHNQIIFGGNYFSDCLPASSCWIVWDKRNEKSDFADCELAWTSFKTAVRKYAYRWNGMIQENQNKLKAEKRYHPTQKPIGLFTAILTNYSKKHDWILDPFAGSGTTGVACEMLNRDYILIEKELEYCKIIKKRLIEETQKRKLINLNEFSTIRRTT